MLHAIGFLANGFLRADGHLAQVIVGAVVDIEVDISLHARQTAHIGMLPELPRALILQGVDIVMGNPIRILVEDGIVEVARLKFKIGIYNRFDLIMFLDDVKPLEHGALELSLHRGSDKPAPEPVYEHCRNGRHHG